MTTSCFFCQNLLSDFIEGILPSGRHDEVKQHLDDCRSCSDTHKDLVSTIEIIGKLELKTPNTEMGMRIAEASHAGRITLWRKVTHSKRLVAAVLVFGLWLGTAFAFPHFPLWSFLFNVGDRESDFVRYYPLLQGATDLLDEQANWLHAREPLMGSLWEEGGAAPEEFEKTFQVRSAPAPATKGEDKSEK